LKHHCNVPEVTRIGKVTKKTGRDTVLTRAQPEITKKIEGQINRSSNIITRIN